MAKYCDPVAAAADCASLKIFLGPLPVSASSVFGCLAPVYHSDVIFAASGFEGKEHKHGISQIGVSTLDTCGLPLASLLGQDLINNHLYCVSGKVNTTAWTKR